MNYTKEEVINRVVKAALDYDKILCKTKYLFLCRNNKTKNIDYFEIRFPKYAFMHLTGLNLSKAGILKSSNDFYKACINKKLSHRDFVIENNISVTNKILILPQLINFIACSKMSVLYNNGRPLLKCDRLVGTTNFCLALNYSDHFYVPVSCLNADVRDFGDDVSQVIAVFSAKLDDSIYNQIQKVAKGINLCSIDLPSDIYNHIDLSQYRNSNFKQNF